MDRQLRGYASAAQATAKTISFASCAAAGLTGAPLPGSTSPALADIIVTQANVTLPVGHGSGGFGTYMLKLDGQAEFTFAAFATAEHFFFYDVLNVVGLRPGASVIVNAEDAAALPARADIGPNQAFAAGGLMARSHNVCTTFGVCSGPFRSGSWFDKTAYLGLKFDVDGQTHFGWAQLSTFPATLIDYGYDTVPGQELTAGEDQIPSPARSGCSRWDHLAWFTGGARRRDQNSGIARQNDRWGC